MKITLYNVKQPIETTCFVRTALISLLERHPKKAEELMKVLTKKIFIYSEQLEESQRNFQERYDS